MQTLAVAMMAAAIAAVLPSFASAQQLEEASILTVTATLFDTRDSTGNGCDPAGCIGDNTIVSTKTHDAELIAIDERMDQTFLKHKINCVFDASDQSPTHCLVGAMMGLLFNTRLI